MKLVEFRIKRVGIRVITGRRDLQGTGTLTPIVSSNADHTSPTLPCRIRAASKLELSNSLKVFLKYK